MNVTVVAVVFGLVLVAELPDKTMIASLLLATRGRPLWVWLGASAAFLVHVGLAVGAGRLLVLLPHRTVEIIVTALFLAGAAYLLVVPERTEETRGARGAARVGPDGAWRLVGTAFAVVAVGEFGDLTQVLLVNLVGHYHLPWSVFVGGALALVSAAALAAFGGRALLRWVPLGLVRRASGLALAGFGAYGIATLVA